MSKNPHLPQQQQQRKQYQQQHYQNKSYHHPHPSHTPASSSSSSSTFSSSSSPTVSDLLTDQLTPLANSYWAPSLAAGNSLLPYDSQIIETIYNQYLVPINKATQQREKIEEEEKSKQSSLASHKEEGELKDNREIAHEKWYKRQHKKWSDSEEKEQAAIDKTRENRLLLLELSAYLENYLWKNFDPQQASFAHVMSIILLLNQKFKENLLGIWESCFASRPATVLIALFERIVKLKSEYDLNVYEANQYLIFLIHAYESFENESVRKVFLRLVSIDCWRGLRDTTLYRIMRESEEAGEKQLIEAWKKLSLKPANDLAAIYFPNMLIEFIHLLYSIDENSPLLTLNRRFTLPYYQRGILLYLERFLEFLTDLLTKRATRRWVRKCLMETHYNILIKESKFFKHTQQKQKEWEEKQRDRRNKKKKGGDNENENNDDNDTAMVDADAASSSSSSSTLLSNRSTRNSSNSTSSLPGRLFVSMLNQFEYYLYFEIDDLTGKPLNSTDILKQHQMDIQIFQKIIFKYFQQDEAIAKLATINSISQIENPIIFEKLLEDIDDATLKQIANKLLLLPNEEEIDVYNKLSAKKQSKSTTARPYVPRFVLPLLPYMNSRAFLISLLIDEYKVRPTTRQQISSLPLYPNETFLFDEHAVPSTNYTGEGCLALPKLNTQYLTYHDYLQRNFFLFKGESTYEIREDIAYNLKRIKPRLNSDNKTIFTGWARAAVPLLEFKLTTIAKPRLGETKPAVVKGELTVDLAYFQGVPREEWEQLKPHDVLFLLNIEALTHAGENVNNHSRNQPLDDSAKRQKYDIEDGELLSDEAMQVEEDFTSLFLTEPMLIHTIRGCVIKSIADSSRRTIGERDQKGNVYRAKGNIRIYRVELDAAQYELDQKLILQNNTTNTRTATTTPSSINEFYSTFNLVLRRKSKENNFSSILSTMVDVMSDLENGVASLPSFLENLLLGYGDPKNACYYSLNNQVKQIEFVDTFLDLKHLKESFYENVKVEKFAKLEEEKNNDNNDDNKMDEEENNETKNKSKEDSLTLMSLSDGGNPRVTAASTSMLLTRQVMKMIIQAEMKQKGDNTENDASSSSSSSSSIDEVDPNTTSFRVTFPTHVEPNYSILQQLLYFHHSKLLPAHHQAVDANVRFVIGEGEETVKATKKLKEKQKEEKEKEEKQKKEKELIEKEKQQQQEDEERMQIEKEEKQQQDQEEEKQEEQGDNNKNNEKEENNDTSKNEEQEKEKEKESITAASQSSSSSSSASVTAAPSLPSLPPSPHTLTVELLPRVTARLSAFKRNQVRFTPIQVEAIKSGLNPGLTVIVGPPGTGELHSQSSITN